MLWDPQIANRPCELCLKYLFNEETGAIEKDRKGEWELREPYGEAGLPMCKTDRGCPKGTPEALRSLNEINQRCYEHYREYRAVGSFPDDPLVRRNAAIIRQIEDEYERFKQAEQKRDLVSIITGLI